MLLYESHRARIVNRWLLVATMQFYVALNLLCPALIGGGIIHRWPSSVRPSVCPVPDSKSRMKGRSNLKIGRKEANDTGDTWPRLEVTRPINAVTENEQYLWNGKAYELQTWNTGGVRRPASLTCAVTSEVKGQGYNVTSSVWHVFAHNWTKKSCRSIKIGKKVVRDTGDIPHQFQGHRSKVKVPRPQHCDRKSVISSAREGLKVTTCRGRGIYCGGRTACFTVQLRMNNVLF